MQYFFFFSRCTYITAELILTNHINRWHFLQACDPRHPRFAVTTSLCRRAAINNTLTSYRWRVAAPTGLTSGSHRLKDVHPAAFLASTHRATLDSIYFTAGESVGQWCWGGGGGCNININRRNGSCNVAGYLIEERRRWPVITASPRGQYSK